MQHIEAKKCIVLNSTYEPLTIITVKRALRLLLQGKAVVVEEYEDVMIRSSNRSFPAPLSIALKYYINGRLVFRKPAPLNNRNLNIRDNYTCQYCGRTKGQLINRERMTRDHIHPKDLGGTDEWLNVALSCNTCNNKKGNKTLTQCNMKLLKEPTVPTIFELWARQAKMSPEFLLQHHI
jgi:5-methylcytosine-specific restriction endonuclease McrA